MSMCARFFTTGHLRLYLDLRAALKVQPSNTEALEELLSVLSSQSPPPPAPSYPDEAASSSVGATSAAPRNIPSSNHNPQIPKPKSQKPLPFGRTKADDRKLKIVPIPVMFEVPKYIPGDPSSTLKATRAQKVKNVTTKTETFVYPSWEKYTVKLVA